MKKCKILILFLVTSLGLNAQDSFDDSNLGAWYMYFWNKDFSESNWGFQGDVQFRNWDYGSDLEQLLLRGGLTYNPADTKSKFTLGYGNITTGEFGEGDNTSSESRIYQEALLPQKIGGRVYLKHRFRYEQRFTDADIIRTRYRYNLFLTVPLNQKTLTKKAIYLALYNELFINGQKDRENGESVEFYDRNRFYAALGYSIKDNVKVQLGWMQQTTNTWSKDQIQLSMHHSF